MAGLVDVAKIAEEFGCSPRQVQLYVKQGMPKAKHGAYDLLECYRWLARKLAKDLETAGDGDGLAREQERWTKAKADLAEIELMEKVGELIPLDVYEKHVSAHILTTRQRLLALPAREAAQLEGEDRATIKVKLLGAVRELLSSMAGKGNSGPAGHHAKRGAHRGTARTGGGKSGSPARAKSKAARDVGAPARPEHQ